MYTTGHCTVQCCVHCLVQCSAVQCSAVPLYARPTGLTLVVVWTVYSWSCPRSWPTLQSAGDWEDTLEIHWRYTGRDGRNRRYSRYNRGWRDSVNISAVSQRISEFLEHLKILNHVSSCFLLKVLEKSFVFFSTMVADIRIAKEIVTGVCVQMNGCTWINVVELCFCGWEALENLCIVSKISFGITKKI